MNYEITAFIIGLAIVVTALLWIGEVVAAWDKLINRK